MHSPHLSQTVTRQPEKGVHKFGMLLSSPLKYISLSVIIELKNREEGLNWLLRSHILSLFILFPYSPIQDCKSTCNITVTLRLYYSYWMSVVKDKTEDKPINDFSLSHWISAILNHRRNRVKLDFSVSPKNENSVVIYLLSCASKPVWLSFFFLYILRNKLFLSI